MKIRKDQVRYGKTLQTRRKTRRKKSLDHIERAKRRKKKIIVKMARKSTKMKSRI